MLAFFLAVLESDEDRRRFAALYEAHHARAEQTALRILRNQDDAEDAVQNTFLQVIRHFEKTYEISWDDLGFWIISIVKNEAIMVLRKKRHEVPEDEDWDEATPAADERLGYQELVRLFSKLPETYRATLEMRYLADYSVHEIADHLRLTESAVSSRISRGRELLQKLAIREGFRT